MKADNHGRPALCSCVRVKCDYIHHLALCKHPLLWLMLTIVLASMYYCSHFTAKMTEAPGTQTTFKCRWVPPKPVKLLHSCFDGSVSSTWSKTEFCSFHKSCMSLESAHLLSLKSSLLPRKPHTRSMVWLIFTELHCGGHCKNINIWVFFLSLSKVCIAEDRVLW